MANFHAELTLPNDPAGVGLARAFVRELAAIAEFPAAEGHALADGAAAACANLVALAFDPGEVRLTRCWATSRRAALTLAIREQGMPSTRRRVRPSIFRRADGCTCRDGTQWYSVTALWTRRTGRISGGRGWSCGLRKPASAGT